MYTQFSGQLNAQTNSHGLWERISGRLSRWVRFLVQEHNRRKAVRLLAKLDNRILRDIGKAESASPIPNGQLGQDPTAFAFSMQLLRGP